MKTKSCKLQKSFLLSICFSVIFFKSLVGVHAQDGSYSTKAQNFLDTYSADNLDVFKFSINEILNSTGDKVENTNGDPQIFGRTDYGSEFFLENELNTTSSIEIPAFVIDDLAENPLSDYFPVIKNGDISLSIDFTDLYDTKNGQAITPEMGFAKLLEPPVGQYVNLKRGDILEFIVEPSATYFEKHQSNKRFFIDRPIPQNPIINEQTVNQNSYSTSTQSSSDEIQQMNLAPGEEAIKLPSGEVKIYVTSVFVPAPASKFEPTQIVMPVLADGDYNYEIEPAPAESFPEDLEVVAIPEEEAEVLSEKVEAIKKEKASLSKPKEDDTPPVLDPGIARMKKLGIFLNDVQKGPSKLLSETKKTIQKEFPTISKELINLIVNLADSDEKFDLIQNPKVFMDNEFAKLSDSTALNLLRGTDLPQKDLAKIYNLILYKFVSDLADLGFDTLRTQKIGFSDNIKNTDQILEQVQLQQDVLAIASLFGSDLEDKDLTSFLIEPVKTKSNSSTALLETNSSQKVIDQIKQFSNFINIINSSSNIINSTGTIPDDDIPVVEINIQLGESIADALQKKLNEDKRLNRNFQTRSQSSKLDKFDFEIPEQDRGSAPSASPPFLVEAPNITDQELQLVAETTEAANNIINETINRMLKELGENSAYSEALQQVSVANNESSVFQGDRETNESLVFSNALSSAKRLREIEDISATFQILGIGS